MLNMHNCNARMLKNEIAIHYMKCKSCIFHLLSENHQASGSRLYRQSGRHVCQSGYLLLPLQQKTGALYRRCHRLLGACHRPYLRFFLLGKENAGERI